MAHVRHKLEGEFTVVGLGCIHLEKTDTKALAAALNYVNDINPDGIILGGDVYDFPGLRKELLRSKNYQLKESSLEKTRQMGLDFYKKLPKKARKWFIRGNHEYRLERYAQMHPEVYDFFCWSSFCKNWLPQGYIPVDFHGGGQELLIGDARFIHGTYWGNGHLKKVLDTYGPNTFYWHTHTLEMMPKKINGLYNAPIVASQGCLEKILPDWKEGAPHNWTNAISTFYFMRNGKFNYYPSIISNGKFIGPNGKVYKA